MGIEIAEKIKQIDGRGKTSFRNRFVRDAALWALLAKGSIYKILTILVIMAVTEGYLFSGSLSRSLQGTPLVNAGFEPVLNYSGAVLVFLGALCLIFIVLLRCETENGGSRWGYTLDRLQISGRRQMLIKLTYNILCFLLLFGVQAWVGLWMCGQYADRMPGELVSPQLVFLAFYRSPFLHNLIPLAEIGKWVRNLLMILALSADLAICQRRRNFVQMYALLMLSVTWMTVDIGFHGAELVADLVYIVVILDAVLRFLGIWGTDKSVQEETGRI